MYYFFLFFFIYVFIYLFRIIIIITVISSLLFCFSFFFYKPFLIKLFVYTTKSIHLLRKSNKFCSSFNKWSDDGAIDCGARRSWSFIEV